jgi:hypothetical protein
VLRDVFEPPPVRFAGDLRAAVERVAPAVDDLARVVPLFFAAPVERELAGFDALEALELDFDAVDPARFAVERELDDLRAPVERELDVLRAALEREPVRPELALPEVALPLADSVGDHLPDITRWAASATASAISEPSLVALETTLLAARSAVSAASSPASRIFLRAAGLALIAAAAAARPAASISLLIAALASLSTVVLFERDDDDPPLDDDEVDRDGDEREDDALLREELLRVDLAIALSPSFGGKTLKCRSGSLMKSKSERRTKCKGHRRISQRCPSTWSAARDVAVRQRLELTNTPFRPPC